MGMNEPYYNEKLIFDPLFKRKFQASMLRERCNPNPDGDIEGGPKPTEKIIIK